MAGPEAGRPEVPIRDAASVILLREGAKGPEVLMGQRGAGAVFMPSKYVFPGGAVDAGDAGIALLRPLPADCARRLADPARPGVAAALAAAAIRELAEETGLLLGAPGDWADAPEDWAPFAARGLRPAADGLAYVFRAITPPGRPRRFDARFFLADVRHARGELSAASDELSHLHWIALADARGLDLPFITEIVLAEVAEIVAAGGRPASVPFFDNSGSESLFRRLV